MVKHVWNDNYNSECIYTHMHAHMQQLNKKDLTKAPVQDFYRLAQNRSRWNEIVTNCDHL